MDDLKERLRAVPAVAFEYEGQIGIEDPSLAHEAAARIAALEEQLAGRDAEIARLTHALKMIAIVEQGCGGTMTFEEMANSAMRQAATAIERGDYRKDGE